ncbi:MAG: RNA polymerase factor sigma-54 [Anaerolineae bacterium]
MMDMEMFHVQEMRPSPTLVAFSQMLQLSGTQLQQAIKQEVEENPALEVEEHEICPLCGEVLSRCHCPVASEWMEPRHLQDSDEDDEYDVLTSVAGQVTLAEHLLRDVSAQIPDEDLFIADYLIGSLDEHGFLDDDVEVVAATLGVDIARVEAILKRIQTVGPVGVGARDVRECLLMQLQRWEERGKAHPLVRPIIENYWSDLGEGRYSYIARALKTDTATVHTARDFIRGYLRPYPVPDLSELGSWAQPTDTPYIAPDIVIRSRPEAPDEFDVEVVESRRYSLRITPMYQELAKPAKTKKLDQPALRPQDQEVIQGYFSRARDFLSRLRDRRETMARVSRYVVERQKGFLLHGPRHLVPLTRAEVAEALGMHESTISRATAEKYVMLPDRQVIPFETFFQPALSVQDVLKEIISQEPKPLTDAQLVEKLAAKGYHIARRTVAKYRARQQIPPSSLR